MNILGRPQWLSLHLSDLDLLVPLLDCTASLRVEEDKEHI